jgi:hypothetical protein
MIVTLQQLNPTLMDRVLNRMVIQDKIKTTQTRTKDIINNRTNLTNRIKP